MYVILYVIENELNKSLGGYLNGVLEIKEKNMNKKNVLGMMICLFWGWMGVEGGGEDVWEVEGCME